MFRDVFIQIFFRRLLTHYFAVDVYVPEAGWNLTLHLGASEVTFFLLPVCGCACIFLKFNVPLKLSLFNQNSRLICQIQMGFYSSSPLPDSCSSLCITINKYKTLQLIKSTQTYITEPCSWYNPYFSIRKRDLVKWPYLFLPESLNPFANGFLSILSLVICKAKIKLSLFLIDRSLRSL